LVNADVVEGDVYGIRLKSFIEGICEYSVIARDEAQIRAGEKVSLNIISKELRRQINLEAKLSGSENPNYKEVFELFDQNKNGSINCEELKFALKKYQLLTTLAESQIPELLAMFDKHKRGSVQLDDFIAFANEGLTKSKSEKQGSSESLLDDEVIE
jgi:Ca2+-binding EF-hand superfamily protein